MSAAQPTAPPINNVLEIADLSVLLPRGADRARAVDGVSLDLRAGEVHCVVGESGSGKSMLSYSVMGLLPPGLSATGRITFAGRDLLRCGEREMRAIRGSKMSMIFQEPMTALNPAYTIANQIGEVYRTHTAATGRAAREQAVADLRSVGLADVERIMASHPHQLSGGQRQRVMIAMALALGPRVLIADEPTTALDVTTQAQILELVRRLQRERGTGVLFITHDFGVVAEIADRVTVMRHGKVVEGGATADVLLDPQHPYTKELIAAVPHLRARAARPVSGAVVMDVAGATKTHVEGARIFGRGRRVAALRDVSLTLRAGETLGVVGESGSGKSTLARCLVQLDPLDAGTLRIDGRETARASGGALKAMRQGVQMVFQDPYASLDPRRRVMDILCEGPLNFGMGRPTARAQALELLRRVGLPEQAAERTPGAFSGGQRQRICIARALSVRPKILVADEAVSALDVSVQQRILRLLDDLKADYDISIVFITHDLRVAATLCDTIAVMRGGAIVEHGPSLDVLTKPTVAYTRALIEAIPGGRIFKTATQDA